MTSYDTPRLRLRMLIAEDAPFILELLNTPGWLQYIGDRKIHSLDAAVRYIQKGPMESYAEHGFGLLWVGLRGEETPIGICGLLKRDYLDAPDIGFAFLPQYQGKSYAYEAAKAVIDEAFGKPGITKILAITMQENAVSIKLLERLGLQFERIITLPDSGEELMLYKIEASPVLLQAEIHANVV